MKNLSKPFTCPICQKSKPWGHMVKHVAYAGDPKHEQWRLSNDLPAIIPFGYLKRYEPSLRLAVVGEFDQ
ncbi:hypothetical protein ES708_23978 [subsurface metagenome]